jgi:hypothetical protein
MRPIAWTAHGTRASLVSDKYIRVPLSYCIKREECVAQVPLAEYDDMIETFPSDRANQPFRMSILPWRLGRGWPVANARGAKPPGEKFALDPVAIGDNGPRWAVCEPGRH